MNSLFNRAKFELAMDEFINDYDVHVINGIFVAIYNNNKCGAFVIDSQDSPDLTPIFNDITFSEVSKDGCCIIGFDVFPGNSAADLDIEDVLSDEISNMLDAGYKDIMLGVKNDVYN